ncbi:isochorismatase family protein [Paenibacillus sp. PastF-3]|uniref:cysteine hydrolase family protein n=1 Tax=Paenibacillus sp. PastF-3 TaxID=2940626 RepID=UPI002473C925|nr:isochorismatase family protein [Paenibacillus sp. PastF-3]
MKIGFLIIDMQNLFLHDHMERLNVSEACEYINHVSGLLRAKDQIVIHIQDMEGANTDTDPEARNIIPEITVAPTDIQMAKEFSNAFWKTDLEQLLREHGVEFIIVAGFAAEHCVTFTINGAQERGFQAAILQKGVLSTQPEAITSIYRDRHMISYPVIEFLMETIA